MKYIIPIYFTLIILAVWGYAFSVAMCLPVMQLVSACALIALFGLGSVAVVVLVWHQAITD